jgi:hypothetical protein
VAGVPIFLLLRAAGQRMSFAAGGAGVHQSVNPVTVSPIRPASTGRQHSIGVSAYPLSGLNGA